MPPAIANIATFCIMAEDDEDDLGELLVAKERSTFTLRAPLIIALENVAEIIMRRSSATKRSGLNRLLRGLPMSILLIYYYAKRVLFL